MSESAPPASPVSSAAPASDTGLSLDTHLGGIDLLVLGSSRDARIDSGVVTATRDLFARAVAAGHGAYDIAVLAELMRAPDA